MQGEPVSCVKCGGNGEGQRKPLSLAGFFLFVQLMFFPFTQAHAFLLKVFFFPFHNF
jgi:hypothetical protein